MVYKCIQEDNIKELRKDVQGSKERDILQSKQYKCLILMKYHLD